MEGEGVRGESRNTREADVTDVASNGLSLKAVGEDAATGTTAGPLCAYLGAMGFLGPDKTLLVEQGVPMGRRSLLSVRLTPDAELSGSGVVVLRGELSLVPH